MVLAGLRMTSVGSMIPFTDGVAPSAGLEESLSLGAALAQVNESLKHRESLLTATAKASRLLLETPDALGAVPAVLRLLGEAAGADRVTLMRAQEGPQRRALARGGKRMGRGWGRALSGAAIQMQL